jgi:hypothetical protein
MSNRPHALAIIIPAWKGRFLGKAVASIAAQTDRRFTLYVCDDASPDQIEAIAREAAGDLPFVFHRFPENLGGSDLVSHWERCIALRKDQQRPEAGQSGSHLLGTTQADAVAERFVPKECGPLASGNASHHPVILPAVCLL